jgi:hypothetical protein
MFNIDIADTNAYRIGGPEAREYITEISVVITYVLNIDHCLRYEECV